MRSVAHPGWSGWRSSLSALTPGQSYEVGYDVVADTTAIQIESVRLAHPVAGVDASFAMASGPCPIGTSASVPTTCDLVTPADVSVRPGAPAKLIGTFAVAADGTYRVDEVIVTYRSGLHRRTVRLGPKVCLSTEPNPATCVTALGS